MDKLCCNRGRRQQPSSRQLPLVGLGIIALCLACVPQAVAGGEAPRWMHALVNASLPSYDEKTDAVLLHSEKNVTVVSLDSRSRGVQDSAAQRPGARDCHCFPQFQQEGDKPTWLVHPGTGQGLRGE